MLELKSENIKKCKLVILTSSIYYEDRKQANSYPVNITFLNKPLTVLALNELWEFFLSSMFSNYKIQLILTYVICFLKRLYKSVVQYLSLNINK